MYSKNQPPVEGPPNKQWAACQQSHCYLLLTVAAVSNITQLALQLPVLTGIQ